MENRKTKEKNQVIIYIDDTGARKEYATYSAAAKDLGVSKQTIADILTGKTKHSRTITGSFVLETRELPTPPSPAELFENLPHEEWLPIAEFPNYEVSNMGRIRKDYKVRPCTAVNKLHYRTTNLVKNGTTYHRTIHRLVALAFVPNPDNKNFVMHLDGDKHNNRADNLAWVHIKETHINVPEERSKLCKRVKCIETGIVYESIKEAAEAVKGSANCIGQAAKGVLHTSAGYHWVFVQNSDF